MSEPRCVDPNWNEVASWEVHWTFWDLPASADDYAHAINRAWLTSELAAGGVVELVRADHLHQVLGVQVRVVADDLLRAIEWATMLMFGLIERAGLELPPSVSMLADEQGLPTPVLREALS